LKRIKFTVTRAVVEIGTNALHSFRFQLRYLRLYLYKGTYAVRRILVAISILFIVKVVLWQYKCYLERDSITNLSQTLDTSRFTASVLPLQYPVRINSILTHYYHYLQVFSHVNHKDYLEVPPRLRMKANVAPKPTAAAVIAASISVIALGIHFLLKCGNIDFFGGMLNMCSLTMSTRFCRITGTTNDN